MSTLPERRLLFLFDMDDVLYRYDWRLRMEGLSALTGHPIPELRRRWWLSGHEELAEAGHYADGDSYLAAFEAAMGCEVPEQEWARVRGAAMTAIPGRLDAVRVASEIGRAALLTNNGPLAGRWIHKWAPDLVPFLGNHLDTSSRFGARKPDAALFTTVLAHHRATPPDTFFADDMPENVEGARAVGIHAVLVTPELDLRQEVVTFAAARGIRVE